MKYKKATPVKLRDVGKDEKWLQDRINDDTSILGLGDLSILQREKLQYTGGKIDFLMFNPDDEVRYEIEIMLGTLDESHIIRTIEYWDIERRRYPSYEHRAVIVAEDITNRFFNIISLMNKAVPIIAIQLDAFVNDNNLLLNFVKVLDLSVTFGDDEQGAIEGADRKYWEARANPKSMELFDSLVSIVNKITAPKITYNKGHIAIGALGRNFLWCHLRKGPRIFFKVKVGEERDNLMSLFEEKGVQCNRDSNPDIIKIGMSIKDFDENQETIENAIKIGEKLSR